MSETINIELIRNSEILINFIKDNNLKEVFKLLSQPIDFDEKTLENTLEESIFHIAIKNNNIIMFNILYKSFPKILDNVINKKITIVENGEEIKKSMLQMCAEKGYVELVNLLLSKDNIDYNLENLINYLIEGDVDSLEIKNIIEEYNIENKIDTKIIDTILGLTRKYNDETICRYAINRNDIEGLKFLIKFYESLELYADILYIAEQKGKEDIITNLIDDFVFPSRNIQDDEGNTLLHYAVLECSLETILYLIEKGAEANIKNYNNLTPADLIFCVENDPNPDYEIIADLLLNEEYLRHIRTDQLEYERIVNEGIQREMGLTERSGNQDILNAVEDFSHQQQREIGGRRRIVESRNTSVKKQALNSIKSFDNNSNLASVYGEGLIHCMSCYIDNLNYDYTVDPIWQFFKNTDIIIVNNPTISEKTIEEIYKLEESYKLEVIKTLNSLTEEDYSVFKTIFSMQKIKEKMNRLSANLYEFVIEDFLIENVNIIDKIRNIFPKGNNLKINMEKLIDFIPFNEDKNINYEKLSNMLVIVNNILPENKFNILLDILEKDFGYKVKKKKDKKDFSDTLTSLELEIDGKILDNEKDAEVKK